MFSNDMQNFVRAIEENNEAVLNEYLARDDMDFSEKNEEGETPLSIAVRANNVRVVEALLLNKKINPNQADKAGLTAFDKALGTNNQNMIKIFESAMSQQEFQNLKLQYFYKDALNNMHKMIILGLNRVNTHLIILRDFPHITNYEGYLPGKYKGNAIKFNFEGKEYPIGYNMILPHNDKVRIEKVVFEVYGGKNASDLQKESNFEPSPSVLTLRTNCAAVYLLLPDYLQDKHQSLMDEALHQSIHAAINYFYETMKHHPEKIHLSLKDRALENAQFFLYGSSFGGRTAIRHCELYPGTFNGYISHDGALDYSISDMPIVGKRKADNPELLSPMAHLNDIKESENLLILQNRDDNNVNIFHALSFYQGLIDQGMSKVARLCFFEQGSPASKDLSLADKGHGFSSDRIRYWDTVFDFMKYGPTKIPELHRMSFLMQERYAKQFFRDIPFTERFLALAHQKYHDKAHFEAYKDQPQWDAIWSAEYKPMLQALLEINTMLDEPRYQEAQMKFLLDEGMITDEAIQNALQNHVHIVKELFKELNDIEVKEDEFIKNSQFIDFYRGLLLSDPRGNPRGYTSFLLENFYFSNPQLLPKLENSQAWTLQQWAEVEKKCRDEFELKNIQFKEAVQQTWQAAGKAVMGKQKHERKLFFHISKELQNIKSNEKPIDKLAELYNRLQLISFNEEAQQVLQEKILNALIKLPGNVSENAIQFLKLTANELKTPIEGYNALNYAIMLRREKLVSILLDVSPDYVNHIFINNNDLRSNALMQAINCLNIPIIKLILEKVPESVNFIIDAGYNKGKNLLMYALSFYDVEIFKSVLEKVPESASYCSYEGLNTLMLAISGNNLKSVNLLLDTAIGPELLKQIIKEGRFVGHNALTLAIVCRNVEIAKLILEKAPDLIYHTISQGKEAGHDPLTLAKSSLINHPEFITMIERLMENKAEKRPEVFRPSHIEKPISSSENIKSTDQESSPQRTPKPE